MAHPAAGTIFAPATVIGRATLARLRHRQTAEVLDEGLVLWVPAPGSFTGEDVLELQVHGGRAVVFGIMEALADLPGCGRPSPASSPAARF